VRVVLIASVVLFVVGVIVGLIQLWLTLWSPELFVKIEFTIGAIFAVMVAIWFTRKEYCDYRRQRNSSSLDE